MTERARWQDDTIPQPRLLHDTLELPPVADVPSVPVPEVAQAAAPVPPAAPRPSRRGTSRWALLLAVALVLVGAAAAGLVQRRAGTSGTSGSAGNATLAVSDVRPVDPSGGSGFRQTASGWRTQHYRSADFGNLKSGVGLLVDLGRDTRVTSVTAQLLVPGTTVELRAGDRSAGLPDSLAAVDRQTDASGGVTLRATDSGAARYWLLWVPRLGRDDAGYAAGVGRLTFRG